MDPVELWHQGWVLIAGDSRVRRLKSVSDPELADNVDFYFKGGIVVDELIDLVNEKITDEHHIVIIVGFIGDEVQKYSHRVNEEGTVNLLQSNESDSSAHVKVAHERWVAQKPGRIIVWTIPYYIDYAPYKTYNSAQLSEYDFGDTLVTSWDYHRRVVAETKTSIFTQGVQEQKWAEGRLASIIRERGLRAASDGQLDSINRASLAWVEKARERISDPHQKSKLIQDDVQAPIDLVDEEEEVLIVEPVHEDDEGIEEDESDN